LAGDGAAFGPPFCHRSAGHRNQWVARAGLSISLYPQEGTAPSKKGKSACGVYLPDLEQPRPPDTPPGMVKLRLVEET